MADKRKFTILCICFLQNCAVYKCINPSSLLITVNNHYKRDQDHFIFNALNSVCS